MGTRGAVVAKDSLSDFAAATVALLRDPARRAALGREAAVAAREWSAGTMAERMIALYEAVAAGRARRRAGH